MIFNDLQENIIQENILYLKADFLGVIGKFFKKTHIKFRKMHENLQLTDLTGSVI